MKMQLNVFLCGLAVLASATVARAQGTAFTYNGRLSDNGSPANGSYDFQFTVYDAGTNGNIIAGPTTASATGVTNGAFVVTLDFGSGVFTGAGRWLDIGVRPNGAGSFTPLTPREKFTASPYAIYSGQAGNANGVSTGSVGAAQLATGGAPGAGQVLGFDGNGLNWTSTSATGWALLGNSATTPGVNFLGTTDGEPLELWVNSTRGLRLEYSGSFNPITKQSTTSVNLIGGYPGNQVFNSAGGATISGGGYNASGILGGDFPNVVGGGFGSIGGGASNSVTGLYGTIGGGHNNSAAGVEAVIPGGAGNEASGAGSFAAGRGAHATHSGSFVWNDGSGSAISSTVGSWDVWANGGANFHTGNNPLTVSGPWLVANGLGGEQAYIGGDGIGNDVQIGSLNSGVTEVYMWNATSGCHMNLHVATLTINGGCDLAEPFEMSANDIPKGAVVIIDEDHPGRLKLSNRPYDTRVAGVVSGANGIHPGVMMRQQDLMEGGENVALSGRAYVLADTSNGAIKPGDLLTTSTTPGHAMKVTDHARARGAVLGKAMSGLSQGDGTVLMLVTLQ
jgi:hypothetical protein